MPPTTTESALVELIVGRPFEAAFPPAAARRRGSRRRARRRRSAGPVVRAGELHARARGDRGHRRRRGQRATPALRLPRGASGAEGRQGRVRRQGSAADLDARSGARRDHVAAGRPQAGGVDAGARRPGERDGPDPAAVQRARASCAGAPSARTVQELVERLRIRTPSLEQPVQFLSGGNQQKVAVARTFLREPTVILAYEPTQGVDVGSRFDIYEALRSRTDGGAAMLVKSSDPLELAGLCDRVLVMSPRADHRGDPRRRAR